MSTLFLDNFEAYADVPTGGNVSTNNVTAGVYAEVLGTLGANGANIVNFKERNWFNAAGNQNGLRKVVPNPSRSMFFAFRVYIEQLPTSDGYAYSPHFWLSDEGNTKLYQFIVSATGQIIIQNGAGAEIARSSAPVITAGTTHHLEVKVDLDSGVHVRIDDGDVDVVSYSGIIATVKVGNVIIAHSQLNSSGYCLYTDFHIWDTIGSRNNTWLGDVRIYAIRPTKDIETGWQTNYRHIVSSGIGDFTHVNGADVNVNNYSNIDFGAGDFTVESWLRFSELEGSGNFANLINTHSSNKSWRMFYDGTLKAMVFEASYNGSTIAVSYAAPYDFKVDTWYHIAASCYNDWLVFYVNGEPVNAGVQLTSPIFAPQGFLIGGRATSNRFRGFMDEVRVTVGVGRYNAPFIPPTTKYPRDTSDNNYNATKLLIGFDGGTVIDESSVPHNISTYTQGDSITFNPLDGFYQYQTIDENYDDTYIRASFRRAEGTFISAINLEDGDTISIGTKNYRFKNTMNSSYDVQIGANLTETFQNFKAAIAAGLGLGTAYYAGTDAHPDVVGSVGANGAFIVRAKVGGAAGNSITTNESSVGAWNANTLTNGMDIPNPTSVGFTDIPEDIINVRSIMIISKAWKSDGGSAKLNTAIVGMGGSSSSNGVRNLSTSPIYYTDVFETDPDSGGVMTPASIAKMKVRFNRVE